jgi:hypothetical protein
MTNPATTVEAMLQPDGVTLHLEQKLTLPPGGVTVTVQPLSPKSGPTMLEVLDRIRHDQQQRGHRPMTEAEMAGEIAQLRAADEEYEARWRQIWSSPGTQNRGAGNP